MGNCVSRINKLESNYSELYDDVKIHKSSVKSDKNAIEAYFHSLRMHIIKDLMRQINSKHTGLSITVTPEVLYDIRK